MKNTYRRLAGRIALIALLANPVSASAQQPPSDAHFVIRQILSRNPSLGSFQTRVHVRIRMLNFPFLSLTLAGTSYFKRPDNYEVIFDRVPAYAGGLKHVFADIADPTSWERDWNVTCAGLQTFDGRSLMELHMTKKIASVTLREADAFVDPSSYTIDRMEWHYTSGGTIAMTQTYKTEGGYSVIAVQHADIQIPHVRAVADATYDTYQTNVAVDDALFSKR